MVSKINVDTILTIKNTQCKDAINFLINQTLEDIAKYSAGVIHTSDDGFSKNLSYIYEPKGRTEGLAGKKLKEKLDEIVFKMLEKNSLLPNSNKDNIRLTPWYLFKYSKEQYIIPHADGSSTSNDGWKQTAAVSIQIKNAECGGEFYTITDSFVDDYDTNTNVRFGLDKTSSKYNYDIYPKWILEDIGIGDVIVFGTNIVHGTKAVLEGEAIKAISFLEVNTNVRK